jgi:branched-chain amino acid aminotransferase
MIQTWKLTKKKIEGTDLSDQSSLDAITRQLPDGYYSTFRTYDGCTRVLGLGNHLQRLPDVDAPSLRRQLNRLLEPYRPGEARVRVIQTEEGQVYVAIEPLKLLPREVYEKGVRVETTEIERESPRLKSTAFIGQSQNARRHLIQSKIFEALLIKNNRILEGMTSNFFYALDKRVLYTAQRGILLGVTRRNVIHVAREHGFEMRYSPLKLDQLPAVKEAFITSSSRGIVPVIQIDVVIVGQGKVGEITKQLSAAYEAYVIQKAERI